MDSNGATTGGDGVTATGQATDGGQRVHFEETLHIKDEAGASRMISFSKAFFVFMIVFSIVSVVLVAGSVMSTFASAFGGVDGIWSAVASIYAQQPLVIAGAGLAVLLMVLYFLVGVFGIRKGMSRAFSEEVTVRVTDSGLSVRQEGGHAQSKWMITPYDPSGVDVPFESITAVEYTDPNESSLRTELGDWRSPKFFAGRSQDWIRIERSEGPAVYVGSDRKRELAETIVRHSPNVETAEPF